jgi:hypothetical protein
MDDELDLLREKLARVTFPAVRLDEFDPDLVGYRCDAEQKGSEPWSFPFTPGCGATRLSGAQTAHGHPHSITGFCDLGTAMRGLP